MKKKSICVSVMHIFRVGVKVDPESYRALVPPCPALTQRAAGGGGEGCAR